MDSTRPPKRKRSEADQISYRDAVPLFDEYETVHYTEAKVLASRGAPRATRVHHIAQSVPVVWEQAPATWAPQDDEQYSLNPDGMSFNNALEADVMQEAPVPKVVKPKKKKSLLARRPHVVWANLHRQNYLEEIVRWAGRGDFKDAVACPDCISRGRQNPGVPLYRCKECFLPDLTCGDCCVKRHRLNPFHHIQHWNGSHFVEVSLKSLGLTIQLNHSGNGCENPIPCHADLLILHVNGIHSVSIRYCGCAR